jgi:hypothetical protein
MSPCHALAQNLNSPENVRRASKPRGTTVEPLRETGTSRIMKPIAAEQLRTPQEIRQERHDARAKAICAGTFAERRHGRSPDELHAQQKELQHQWESRPSRRKSAKAKSRGR